MPQININNSKNENEVNLYFGYYWYLVIKNIWTYSQQFVTDKIIIKYF